MSEVNWAKVSCGVCGILLTEHVGKRYSAAVGMHSWEPESTKAKEWMQYVETVRRDRQQKWYDREDTDPDPDLAVPPREPVREPAKLPERSGETLEVAGIPVSQNVSLGPGQVFIGSMGADADNPDDWTEIGLVDRVSQQLAELEESDESQRVSLSLTQTFTMRFDGHLFTHEEVERMGGIPYVESDHEREDEG